MAAAKSKRRDRRRQPYKTPDRFDGIKRRLEQGPFHDHKFIMNPEGAEKMSDVLARFVEPYVDAADTKDAHQKPLTLAVTAWNAALYPEAERARMLDDILGEGWTGVPKGLRAELRKFVGELIVRKLTHFPDNRRAIIDFCVEESRTGFHLSVVSTLETPAIE